MEGIDPRKSLIGKTIGNYRILEEIGRGGMGVVYRAVHIQTEHKIAVKVLKKELASNEEFVKRFLQEGKIAASLNHANLVRVYEVGQHGDRYVMALKHVEGHTLADVIHKYAPLSVRRALDITRQIALGLDHAHRHGVIHRDIKPDNIIVDKNGHAMLTDFGLAKGYESLTPVTNVGTLLGTPGYMSPEQWRSEELTMCTDLYSLGIVLFEMLTGKTPFHSNTPAGMMHEVLEKRFPSASNYNAEVDSTIDRIISNMVGKSITERYASAKLLIRDIDTYKERGKLNGASDAQFTFQLQNDTIEGIVTASQDGIRKRKHGRLHRLLTSPVGLLVLFVTVPALSAGISSGYINIDHPFDLSSVFAGSSNDIPEDTALFEEDDSADFSGLPVPDQKHIVLRKNFLKMMDLYIDRMGEKWVSDGNISRRRQKVALRELTLGKRLEIDPDARISWFAGQRVNNPGSLASAMKQIRDEVDDYERDSIEVVLREPGSDETIRVQLDLVR